MKNSIIMALIAPALILGACKSAEQTEDKSAQTETASMAQTASLATCPGDKVISDISVYPSDLPDPELSNEAWLEANGNRDGVITTESGLQYRVVKSGDPKSPSPVGNQGVTVNYHGFFKNGEVFDSSYTRGEPMVHTANGFIKGWNEAMGIMKPCDAWTAYIPSELAYGSNPPGGLPADAIMIFHFQLLAVDP